MIITTIVGIIMIILIIFIIKYIIRISKSSEGSSNSGDIWDLSKTVVGTAVAVGTLAAAYQILKPKKPVKQTQQTKRRNSDWEDILEAFLSGCTRQDRTVSSYSDYFEGLEAFTKSLPECTRQDRIVSSYTVYQEDPNKLNPILEAFATNYVKRDKQETRNAREYVTQIIEKILKQVKLEDSIFDFQTVRAGSDFQKVAVKTKSDIDIVLEFKNSPPICDIEGNCNSPTGWCTLELRRSPATEWNRFTQGDDPRLSSAQLRSRFAWCVSKAITDLGYSNVQNNRVHGPAVPLKITHPNGRVFDVDLVLGIRRKIWPLEARQHSIGWPGMNKVIANGTHLVPKLHSWHDDRDILWSISFFAAENTMLRQYGCRRKVLRILKALAARSIGQPLTSYHLKNIWLYECEKYPNNSYWTQEKLGERFMGLLLSLEDCLQKRECTHFFMEEINLFKNINAENLQGKANIVRKIRRNPESYLLLCIINGKTSHDPITLTHDDI